MISLYLDNPDDPTLASYAVNSRVEITSLFVCTLCLSNGASICAFIPRFAAPCLPSAIVADWISEQVYASYRHLGIGARAIQEMERRAKAFGATHTTFNTMAVERHLRVFKEELGYTEYKPRSATYSVADLVGAGFPATYQVAAFLEKAL